MTEVRCPLLCGRAGERQALREALRAALDGRGGMVLLTGPPGIGKSRLVRELAGEAARERVSVAVGRAVPTATSAPYRPLTQALLQVLRDRSLPQDPGLTSWLPALGAVVPLAERTERGDASPAVRGEAVLQLLRRLAAPRPLVAVLEDLHWSDPDTLAVLEYLSDSLGTEPLLWIATVRDDPPSPALQLVRRLRGRPGVTHLALDPLDEEQVARMVRACGQGASEDVVARVQRTADGVPLLVEEILASPGVPASFQETVRARLAGLAEPDRLTLESAAVMGRHFDWQLLPAATGLTAELVWRALEHGKSLGLLTVEGDGFRFRHALTREALLDGTLPPARRALAAAALRALEAAHPDPLGSWRELAADLAERSGDRERAGALLAASGVSALERGALSTAIDTLRRAVVALGDGGARSDAETALIRALAQAGRVDEALAAGDELVASLARGPAPAAARAEVQVALAHAAVEADRWPAAARSLAAAEALVPETERGQAWAEVTVLKAEVALAGDEVDRARGLAEEVLAGAGPEARCRAFEILGRIERLRDLGAARDAFAGALGTATEAGLRVWRLRALHELGTIELLDHAGTARLIEARRMALELGALRTAAVLDLQLAAACGARFALHDQARHAQEAFETSDRLRLDAIRAKALFFLAENRAWRRMPEEMERYLELVAAAAPGDRELEAYAWGNCRGLLALFDDDRTAALSCIGRGIELLRAVPHPEPVDYRAVWPLLLATERDPRAAMALTEARRPDVTVAFSNRGLLAYAEAVLAGRAGDGGRATDLARSADAYLVRFPVWGHLARLLSAEPARDGGWGDPERWLRNAERPLREAGMEPLALRCRRLRVGPADPLAGLGITAREREVLDLVAGGLSNKEIAARLHLSVRTVEKHVEALLRKAEAQSRTHLVAVTMGRRTT